MKLSGLRVLNTRPAHQAGELTRLLKEHGAEVVELPVLTIEHIPISRELLEAVESSRAGDFLVFTSANAVRSFFSQATDRLKDGVSRFRIATVGKQTESVVESFGFNVSLVPQKECAEALAESLEEELGENSIGCIFLKGDSARDYLERRLSGRIKSFVVYRSIPNQISPPGAVDALIFTSSLAARSYFESLTELLRREQLALPLVAVGEPTERTLIELGAKRIIRASQPSDREIVSTLLAVHPRQD